MAGKGYKPSNPLGNGNRQGSNPIKNNIPNDADRPFKTVNPPANGFQQTVDVGKLSTWNPNKPMT